MKDLKIAREQLKDSRSALVVVKDGAVIAQKCGAGIGPLIETIDELGGDIVGSSIADKVIGKAAAMLCIHYKVGAIYTPVLGINAQKVLDGFGLYYEADSIVPSILNNDGTDSCPLEKVTSAIDNPDRAVAEIMRFLQPHTRHNVAGE
jgi:hypothetical protein